MEQEGQAWRLLHRHRHIRLARTSFPLQGSPVQHAISVPHGVPLAWLAGVSQAWSFLTADYYCDVLRAADRRYSMHVENFTDWTACQTCGDGLESAVSGGSREGLLVC